MEVIAGALEAAILLATSRHPDGRGAVIIGSVMLVVSIVEAVSNRKTTETAGQKIRIWAGRGFAIAVWLLMIVAGILLLMGSHL